jgi:hypothetical protein
MKMSHGNPLFSYLQQTKLSFYFSSTVSENRRVRTGPVWGSLVLMGVGRMWRKVIRRLI